MNVSQELISSIFGAFTVVNISSNVTLAINTYSLVDTSAPRTLTMPAPTAKGFFYVKDVTFQAQTNPITFLQNGSEKIEGTAGSYIFSANGGSIQFFSDGTDWFVMN